jgi:CIC family chloride channel protein
MSEGRQARHPGGFRIPALLAATFREERRLLLDTLLLGIVGALAAQLFSWMVNLANALLLGRIAGVVLPPPPREGLASAPIQTGPHGLWLIPLVTTLGGLAAGALVYSLAPEAEGHGTDTAVAAFHRSAGRIRARVPPLKLLASAITIGSGGAAGREGPTALISAGIASIYASWTKRPDDERRLLMLVGMAAGLSAIFRSPIGAGLFAIEVLYSEMEFEAGGLVYTMLGSVVAYAVNGLFSGWEPLFRVPASVAIPSSGQGLGYVALGIGAGLVATLLPSVFYGMRDLFRAVPIPPQLKPALGGLGVGLMALWLPQVLGGGYGFIQQAIDGQLAMGLLATLLFAKMLALGLTVSSGGSGGVFAPTLFLGAMLGGFVAHLLHQPPSGYVVVGMAAVFAGAARVPIATMLMVTEMTGGYQLIVPATLAVMLSYVVQVAGTRRLRYRSLYEAQVPGRADSAAHVADYLDAVLHLLDQRKLPLAESARHLDLRGLLASGIAVDLTEGKQMVVAEVPVRSPLIGKTIRDAFAGKRAVLELAALFRQEHSLLPQPGIALRARDLLLVVGGPDVREQLQQLIGAPA